MVSCNYLKSNNMHGISKNMILGNCLNVYLAWTASNTVQGLMKNDRTFCNKSCKTSQTSPNPLKLRLCPLSSSSGHSGRHILPAGSAAPHEYGCEGRRCPSDHSEELRGHSLSFSRLGDVCEIVHAMLQKVHDHLKSMYCLALLLLGLMRRRKISCFCVCVEP